MLQVKERAPTPSSIVVSFRLTFESFKEFEGVWYMVMVGVKQHKAHRPQRRK